MKTTMTMFAKLSRCAAARRSLGVGSILAVLTLTLVGCGSSNPAGAAAQPAGSIAAATNATPPVTEPAMDHSAMDHAAMDHAEGGAGGVSDSVAARFAEELFGENGGDYGLSFTPDGRTVLFTRAMPTVGNEAIYLSRLEGGQWGAPTAAPFSGRFHDKEPYVSPDGSRVYFASRRPLRGSSERSDFDIWYAPRGSAGWGDPVHVEAVSSSYDDDYPAVAADGTLVFSRTDGEGNVDLWVADGSPGGLHEPRRLDRPIKSVYAEADAWIAPDGSSIVYSSPRITEGSQGQGDLYIVHRGVDGWTAPVPLGLQVNSIAHEYGPALSADGATFYFSRGFGGQVWTLPTAALSGFDGGRP